MFDFRGLTEPIDVSLVRRISKNQEVFSENRAPGVLGPLAAIRAR